MIATAVAALGDAIDALMDADLSTLSDADLTGVMTELERRQRQWTTIVQSRLVVEAAARNLAGKSGIRSLQRYLRATLGLSEREAWARVRHAERFGETPTPDGEPVSRYPLITALMRQGRVGVDHGHEIGKIFRTLPVDYTVEERRMVEQALADAAPGCYPEELAGVVEHTMAGRDPDTVLGSAKDRARRRGITIGAVREDGTAALRGDLTAPLVARLQVYLAKYAQPGWCVPDEQTDVSPYEIEGLTPLDPATRAAIATGQDARSYPQRVHDAIGELVRMGLEGFPPGGLGEHNGFPMTVIATMTLDDLENQTGMATTATGLTLPVAEVIRMAHSYRPYLCVIDRDNRPLYLGRGPRVASLDQRLALAATERGCTAPGCGRAALHTQVHHRDRDWNHGGRTDIDQLTLRCPPDHAALAPNNGVDTPEGLHTTTATTDTARHIPGATAGQTLTIPPATIDPQRRPHINTRHQPGRTISQALTHIRKRRETEHHDTQDDEPPG